MFNRNGICIETNTIIKLPCQLPTYHPIYDQNINVSSNV